MRGCPKISWISLGQPKRFLIAWETRKQKNAVDNLNSQQ